MPYVAPTISVLMSVYNGENYLSEAIKSVLAQTYRDFEFIIYDDASTDGSSRILNYFADLDKRITLITNSKNRGLTANLKEGVNKANGKYLARMDADDICLPNRFQVQVNFFQEHDEISLLGSSVIYFDGAGKEFVAYQVVDHEEIKIQLLLGFTLLHPSVMLRIEKFRDHDLNYDESHKYAQDHELWARAILVVKAYNIREPLLKMREHSNKISFTLKPEQQYFSNKSRNFQLKMYGFSLSDDQLLAFHNLCSGKANFSKKELLCFEKTLVSLINQNEISNVLNQKYLETMAAKLFRLKCRQMMLEQSNGAYWIYYNSLLRSYDKLSYYAAFKFFISSLLITLKNQKRFA
ncbi:MAG: glycosyltransferase [Psychroserpens sp.]|uniref:glycosyltransferase family 2 protein n=1 Tax=Psychroserpens sp. TaxID=2020870 RepID=UPI003CB94860